MNWKVWKRSAKATKPRAAPKKKRPKKSKQPKPPKAKSPMSTGVGDDLKREWPVVLTAVISFGALLAVILYGVLTSPK